MWIFNNNSRLISSGPKPRNVVVVVVVVVGVVVDFDPRYLSLR